MPVAAVKGLKYAASCAAVKLPPQEFTYNVRVCAIVRSVMRRGASVAVAAAAPAFCRKRRRLRSKRHVILMASLPVLSKFRILSPREHVRIDRRPGQRQCGSRAQALAIPAADARAQRQPARLADHQDGIA